MGATLSTDELCAVIRRAGQTRAESWRVPVTPLNGEGGGWSGLTDALRLLARDAGVTEGRLSVALMPPLAEARAVSLPPLSENERRQLLSRGASKYFVAARGAQIVGAVPASSKAAAPSVAAAANARLVNAIQDAARSAGWELEAVLPAEAAWGAAAAQWARRASGVTQLLVAHPERTDLLSVENGQLTELRRFHAGGADAARIADAFAGASSRLAVVGNTEQRHGLTRALAAHGVAAEAPPGLSADIIEHPELLAAAFASPDTAPLLRTDAMRAGRLMYARRIATRVAAAAGVLLAASIALEWWGLRREAESVRAQRAELAPQISSTLVGRSTVEVAFRQLATLAAEQRATPQWSGALAALSDRLPVDAYFTGFRGRADSVAVDGLATRAARVFTAIEGMPELVGVRSAGPVRIEAVEEGPPMERFAIAARLAPRVVPGATPARAQPRARPPAAVPPAGARQ